jgi:hypothetical protein
MQTMPAQQVMGPDCIHGTLSLMAQCNNNSVLFIWHNLSFVIENDDLEHKLALNLPCAKGVQS